VSREETGEERLQRGYVMNQLAVEEAKDYDRGKYSRRLDAYAINQQDNQHQYH